MISKAVKLEIYTREYMFEDEHEDDISLSEYYIFDLDGNRLCKPHEIGDTYTWNECESYRDFLDFLDACMITEGRVAFYKVEINDLVKLGELGISLRIELDKKEYGDDVCGM